MERENWRRDPDWIATMGKLGPEIQWYTCDCGAHWLGLHCGPECVHSHRQYPDWNLCNWPPEMLKYWDIKNWRARTPPVDYPDITPPRRMHHVVFKDVDTGTVWFGAFMTTERLAHFRKLLWTETSKGATLRETPKS